MTRTLPRIQVAVTPDTDRIVTRLAKATRLSKSRICADVIEEAAPLMARSLKMLLDAAKLTEQARVELRKDIAREERIMQTAAGSAFGALAAAEAAIAKAGGGRVAAASGPAKTGIRRRRSTPAK